MKKILATPREATAEPFDPKGMVGLRSLAPFEPSGPMTECTVQNGRTLQVPSPSGQRRIVGFDAGKNENVFALVTEVFQPGQSLSLPLSEYQRLLAAGFVVAPEDYREPPAPQERERHAFGPKEAQ